MPRGVYKRDKKMKTGRWKIGTHLSQQTKEKIGNSNRGKKRSLEARAKYSAAKKGKLLSKNHRKNLSIAQQKRDYTTFNWSGLQKSWGTKWLIGRKQTKEHIAKRMEGLKKAYDKKGRKEYKRYIHKSSKELVEWRIAVFKRDNYTCRCCGSKNGLGTEVVLNAHHIKQWATYPELRYIISNGLTLCIHCHEKTDTYRKLQKC